MVIQIAPTFLGAYSPLNVTVVKSTVSLGMPVGWPAPVLAPELVAVWAPLPEEAALLGPLPLVVLAGLVAALLPPIPEVPPAPPALLSPGKGAQNSASPPAAEYQLAARAAVARVRVHEATGGR